jgi:hypothetical protein
MAADLNKKVMLIDAEIFTFGFGSHWLRAIYIRRPSSTGEAYIPLRSKSDGLPANTSRKIPPKIVVISPMTTAIAGLKPKEMVLAAAVIEKSAIPSASKYNSNWWRLDKLLTIKKRPVALLLQAIKTTSLSPKKWGAAPILYL